MKALSVTGLEERRTASTCLCTPTRTPCLLPYIGSSDTAICISARCGTATCLTLPAKTVTVERASLTHPCYVSPFLYSSSMRLPDVKIEGGVKTSCRTRFRQQGHGTKQACCPTGRGRSTQDERVPTTFFSAMPVRERAEQTRTSATTVVAPTGNEGTWERTKLVAGDAEIYTFRTVCTTVLLRTLTAHAGVTTHIT